VEFEVDLVAEIKWNVLAFSSLELPGDYKKMLLAFSRGQQSASSQFDDVIEGKGKESNPQTYTSMDMSRLTTAKDVVWSCFWRARPGWAKR
jgi:hypothetical protein